MEGKCLSQYVKIPEKIKKSIIILTVIGTIVLISGIFASKQAWQQHDLNDQRPIVKTVQAKRQDMTVKINTNGTLRCTNQQNYYARTSSTVKEIRKSEGSKVTIGEVILLLDNTHALLELGNAENTLDLLQRDYLQAVSDKVFLIRKRDSARKDLKRIEQLYAMGAIPLKDLETAQLALANTENQINSIDLKAIEARINRGKLVVQAAREQLAATVITSPFDGTLLKVAVNRGEPIKKDKFLFSIGQTDNLETTVSLNESDAVKIKTGLTADLSVEAMNNKIYKGHVTYIAPQAETESTGQGMESKVKVIVKLDDKEVDLKPGFTVTASLISDERKNVITVPKEAILERNGKKTAFVYNKGKAQMREVQLGICNELFYEVMLGLNEGEKVIISPLDKVKDGLPVKLPD
jgi:HlyD family secretion protein